MKNSLYILSIHLYLFLSSKSIRHCLHYGSISSDSNFKAIFFPFIHLTSVYCTFIICKMSRVLWAMI